MITAGDPNRLPLRALPRPRLRAASSPPRGVRHQRSRSAPTCSWPYVYAFRRCACSSPAAPASSARTSRSASLQRGRSSRCSTSSPTPAIAPTSTAPTSSSWWATSPTPRRSRKRPPARMRSSTSPRRRTSTARSSGPPSSSGPTCSAPTCCSRRPAEASVRLRAGLDRRGLRRRSRGRSSLHGEEPRTRRTARTRRRRPAETSRCSPPFRTFGIDACITRGANTYGPNQYPEKLIPLIVTNALDGEPLPVYGDGRQRREWLHVRGPLRRGRARSPARGNLARSTTSAARSTRTSRSRAAFLELTGADPGLVRHVDDRPGHDRRYSLDDSKLRALGWSARAPLEDGLAETVEWYRDNRDWWEPIKSGEYRAYYEQQYADRLG